MKQLFTQILFILLLCIDSSVWAANHYIRDGGTGSTPCSDWSTACDVLPASLVRGDTYYIAGGSYAAYTFDDAESGTSVITIKKAIASDHGTDTGWQSSYGTTQAVFNRIIRFNTGYYVFDGQTRNESDWFEGASYGFQVYHNNSPLQLIIIDISGNKSATDITLKHVYVNAQYQIVPTDTTITALAISTDTWGDAPHTGLIFTNMFVRGTSNHWFLRNTNGAIIQYSASEGAQSTAANHGEVINLYYTGANATVRYNKFRDEYLGYGGTALVAITNPNGETANGLSFYGNVAWDFEVGDAAVGFNGYLTNNNKVYNNTFVRGVGYNSGTAFGSGTGNTVYNNLYINCNTVTLGGTHNYNGFSDSNSRGEGNAQINIPTSIFTNYASDIFTLSTATTAGTTLSSPYNLDMLNTTRGSSGVWDKGAYEFVTGGVAPVLTSVNCSPSQIQSPSQQASCTVVVASGTPTSYTGTVTDCTAAQCSTASTTNPLTYSCLYGGACTVSVLAGSANGNSNSVTTSLVSKYRKPSNVQIQ